MDFAAMRKLILTIRKHPIPTASLLLLLLFFLAIKFLPNQMPKVQTTVQQSTTGDQSPAVSTHSGNITINYGMAKETMKILDQYIQSKEIQADRLQKELSDAYSKQLSTPPQEADAWARHFVESMAIRKGKITLEEEQRETARQNILHASKRLETELDVLVKNLTAKVDSLVEAGLRNHIQVTYQRHTFPYIFVSPNNTTQISLRTIIFPKKSSIKVTLMPGFIKDDIITEYPSLKFYYTTNNIKQLAFSVYIKQYVQEGNIKVSIPTAQIPQPPKREKIQDIIIEIKGFDLITDLSQIANSFVQAFDKLFGNVYVLDELIPN